jgi:hypothetical protein
LGEIHTWFEGNHSWFEGNLKCKTPANSGFEGAEMGAPVVKYLFFVVV